VADHQHLRGASLLGLAVVFAAPAAGAEPAARPLTEAIRVERGATCIDVQDLAGEVATWLDTDRVEPDVWVRVEGSAGDPRVASFEMGRGSDVLARRRFDPGPERCEHLEAMLGLAIALAIKVSLVQDLAELTGEAPRAPEPPPPDVWRLGARALAALGVVPGLAAGAEVRVEAALPPNFVLRAGLFGVAGPDGNFGHGPGAFSTEIAALRADACVRLDLGPRARTVHVKGCTGFLAGGLFLQGRGFPASQSASTSWFALAAAADVGVDLGARWSLDAELAVVLPLGHATVGTLSATGAVVDSREFGSAGATVALGPSYRF
jgi:hypothetical protein